MHHRAFKYLSAIALTAATSVAIAASDAKQVPRAPDEDRPAGEGGRGFGGLPERRAGQERAVRPAARMRITPVRSSAYRRPAARMGEA